MIKILSTISEQGGSTIALINLTNVLNKAGYPTIFYGPHEWHLNKCKSRLLKFYEPTPQETLIFHHIHINERPQWAKRVLFVSHEKESFEVKDLNLFYDEAIFTNQKHYEYHQTHLNHVIPHRIIPNFRRKLKSVEKSSDAKKCAGVIGYIHPFKQTHISIQKAIDDGYEKVYLFGLLPDDEICFSYYEKNIDPLIKKYPNQIIKYGFIENQSEMYAMINAVYFFPLTDVASHIQYECEATNTILYGNDVAYYADNTWSNRKILNAWIDVLNLK